MAHMQYEMPNPKLSEEIQNNDETISGGLLDCMECICSCTYVAVGGGGGWDDAITNGMEWTGWEKLNIILTLQKWIFRIHFT